MHSTWIDVSEIIYQVQSIISYLYYWETDWDKHKIQELSKKERWFNIHGFDRYRKQIKIGFIIVYVHELQKKS